MVHTLGLGLVALLGVLACSCRRDLPKPTEGQATRMTTPLRFDAPGRAPASSFPFASSLRNSRVDVARRRYVGLDRHPFPGHAGAEVAPFVASRLSVSPGGAHALLRTRFAEGIQLDGAGNESGSRVRSGQGQAGPAALDDFGVENDAFTWKELGSREERLSGQTFAFRIDANEYVAATAGVQHPHDGPSERFGIERQLLHAAFAQGLVWSQAVDGREIAVAIDASWNVVVAVQETTLSPTSRIEIYAAAGGPRKTGDLLLKRAFDFVSSDMSLVPPYVAVLETRGSGARLHAMLGDGDVAWVVDVPFRVMQPPVDGGSGRVYLAGEGLATIQDGRVVSVVQSPAPLQVTAFQDGSLAVSTSKDLQLVSTSGVIEQRFETAEPLVTPPAITASGDVWVASDKAVYVLR